MPCLECEANGASTSEHMMSIGIAHCLEKCSPCVVFAAFKKVTLTFFPQEPVPAEFSVRLVSYV